MVCGYLILPEVRGHVYIFVLFLFAKDIVPYPMMLAILIILSGFDFSHRSETENNRASKVVNETINAIIFDSVLCIFLMIYGLIIIVLEGASLPKFPINASIIKAILSGAAYYIFTVILLNLLLIIKHMSNIIKYRMIIKKEDKK